MTLHALWPDGDVIHIPVDPNDAECTLSLCGELFDVKDNNVYVAEQYLLDTDFCPKCVDGWLRRQAPKPVPVETEVDNADDVLEARIQLAAEAMDDELRRIGLHVQRTQVIDPEKMPQAMVPGRIVYIEAIIGDLAFTKRVQDPVQHEFDHEFRKMEHSAAADDFLDMRTQLEERMRDGKPLFGGDDPQGTGNTEPSD